MKLPRYQQIRKVPGQAHPTAASAVSSSSSPSREISSSMDAPMQSTTADLDIGPLPGVAPGSRRNRPAAFPLLRPRLPRQQCRDGLAGREAAFDDGQHGAADGQVHAQRLGTRHDGGAAGHAFGDVAQGGQDVGQ